MVRNKSSRSRSRSRDRSKRDKERERERDRDRERKKERESRHHKSSKRSSRSRSRSPRDKKEKKSSTRDKTRRRSRSSSSSSDSSLTGQGLTLGGNLKTKLPTTSMMSSSDKNSFILDPKEMEGKSAEEIEMLQVMGFTGFDTTKNKHVDGACNAFAINIQQKRKYRQYMNRKGGFNKPLDPVA